MTPVVIRPGEQPQPIAPANGDCFTLEELQQLVGGYIEIACKDGETLMIVNEEGKIDGLPINAVATRVFREWHPGSNDYILGPAVFCNSKQLD